MNSGTRNYAIVTAAYWGFTLSDGGLLLQALGFQAALWTMPALLALVFIGVVSFVPSLMGKSKASKSAREVFAKNRGVKLLAAARVTLFGAREVWFVVSVPVFLHDSGWSFAMVGGLLALWTIGYGAVQAAVPAIVQRGDDGLSAEVPAARRWSPLLALIPLVLAVMVAVELPNLEWVVVAGLGISGIAFAIHLSAHSHLILAYAGSGKAAEDVGFHYTANALGRFLGTLRSGLLYQWGRAAVLAGRVGIDAGRLLAGDAGPAGAKPAAAGREPATLDAGAQDCTDFFCTPVVEHRSAAMRACHPSRN